MSYIGSTPQTQAFTPAVDYFSGNGSTTAFTLSRPVASVAQVQVVIDNVAQNPSLAFTVSGNTVTFTSAPLSGTNNIYVYYTSPITQVIAPGPGTVGPAELKAGAVSAASVSDQANTSTGYFSVPSGTTAQRPASPSNGMIRYNTSYAQFEMYQNGGWAAISYSNLGVYTINYLVIAGGGGGGGQYYAGGGGAGGALTSSLTVTKTTAYSVVVGAGGAGGAGNARGSNGSNSSFGSIITIGGGGGGAWNNFDATSGGSGGGGSLYYNTNKGAGTTGQGYDGALGSGYSTYQSSGGGGGGGGAGGVAQYVLGTAVTGAGGVGISSDISGSTVLYAGGGGGGAYNVARENGAAWAYGGGQGSAINVNDNTAGATNKGGGGGGTYSGSGSAGGSGVVIISYIGTQRATGGTVTSVNGYTVHTFTTSGTFTA